MKHKLNPLEKAIINQGKKVLIRHAQKEIEAYKKRLAEAKTVFHLDIFNTGLLLDIRAAQLKALEAIETQILKRKPR